MSDDGPMDWDQRDTDVLVVGAGVAGLAAARSLAEQGKRVLVLEAQGRIGGRILTQRMGDEVIELGAEFVHGRSPDLIALIEEAGLELRERTGSFVHDRRGALTADAEDSGDAADPFSLLDTLKGRSGPDLTFAELLEDMKIAGEPRDQAVGYVEGFNAADHRVISAQALGMQQEAEEAIEGDRSFHLTGGYDQLVRFLAARFEEHGGELRLNTRVDRIQWQPGRVLAGTEQGSFTARRAVLALPLGVLQSGAVKFEPAMPDRVSQVFTRDGPIRMGSALRFTMVFREQFWKKLAPQPAMGELSFLIARESMPPVWWTPHPEMSNMLTGWVGGPRTEKLAGLSAERMAEQGCEALAKIFHHDAGFIRGLLTGCYTHDWSADPHSLGAYSYIAKGGLTALANLIEPLLETLYFAGEHTATDGHWGTVHAALGSGLRAARQIAADDNEGAE